jgi:hypothetical protein
MKPRSTHTARHALHDAEFGPNEGPLHHQVTREAEELDSLKDQQRLCITRLEKATQRYRRLLVMLNACVSLAEEKSQDSLEEEMKVVERRICELVLERRQLIQKIAMRQRRFSFVKSLLSMR